MKISIHESAAKEFDEAVEWYEIQSEGLGKRFKRSVMEQIGRIKANPNSFLKETDDICKAYVPKFPYKILFTSDKDRIIVWAVAHMHRKPYYWESRMI